MPVVSLREVVEALDLQSDELLSYLDLDSGEIVTFNQEEARIARSGEWDNAPRWMREYLPKVKRALEGDRLLQLPDRAHIDEWRMMQEFASAEEQCSCRTELVSAASGAHAFRSFRDTIQRLGLEDAWQRHRQAAYTNFAREWLQENDISFR
jgi:hypothetical protein